MILERNHTAPVRPASGGQAHVLPALLEEHLPIVEQEVHRTMRRAPAHAEREEIHGCAVQGLMQAASRYDPQQHACFHAYVRRRVRGAIMDYLRSVDEMPRGARRQAKVFNARVAAVEQFLQRTASHEDIREGLSLSHEQYEALARRIRPVEKVSLDAPANPQRCEDALLHQIADESALPVYRLVEEEELRRMVREQLALLSPRYRKLLAMYYYEGLSLNQIGRVWGISEARACQLKKKAIGRLREQVLQAC